jgi:hypothetical protein
VTEHRDERRRAPRFGLSGEAVWRHGEIEGGCRVLSLSAGGLEVAGVVARFAVGARLTLSFAIQGERYDDLLVEVVRASRPDALALRFVHPTPELARRIGELTEDRTPLP